MPRIEITGIEKNVDAKFLKENIEQFEMINANVQNPPLVLTVWAAALYVNSLSSQSNPRG